MGGNEGVTADGRRIGSMVASMASEKASGVYITQVRYIVVLSVTIIPWYSTRAKRMFI